MVEKRSNSCTLGELVSIAFAVRIVSYPDCSERRGQSPRSADELSYSALRAHDYEGARGEVTQRLFRVEFPTLAKHLLRILVLRRCAECKIADEQFVNLEPKCSDS